MELTGIPNIELYVTSTYKDGIFIAVLEEVTPDNVSHFLTEGFIRASHSKIQRNSVYESMGLCYHRGFREDIVEMSEDTPLKLDFHLEALSRIIKAGNSAPLCLVHGIFDYGIQVPMGQSVRMFKEYSRKGVKSIVLLNNNGPFGDDPEVMNAVVQFMTNRI